MRSPARQSAEIQLFLSSELEVLKTRATLPASICAKPLMVPTKSALRANRVEKTLFAGKPLTLEKARRVRASLSNKPLAVETAVNGFFSSLKVETWVTKRLGNSAFSASDDSLKSASKRAAPPFVAANISLFSTARVKK